MNKQRSFYLLAAVVGLILLSALAWWWQRREPAPPANATAVAGAPAAPAAAGPPGPAAPIAVEVAQAQRGLAVDDTTAVGSFRSRQGVIVRPEVSGRIAKLGFADGQRVSRGQLLVQLDDSLQRAQAQQAEAQASIARTTLKRNQELVAQAFVTQSVVDQAQSNLEVAQAQVALAQAQLNRMRVLAPFDGVAGIRQVNIGDFVKEGADVVTLEDTSSLYVDFRLPERFIARLQPKQKIDVTVDALPGQRFAAAIEALEAQVDPQGRSLAVRALMPRPSAELKPGMFARVRVLLDARDDAVLVPEEALVPQGAKQFVVKAVKDPKGEAKGPVSKRAEVQTGVRHDGKVEILSGVAAGDVVVTAGQARLMRGDGLPLQVVQVGAPAAAKAPPAAAASKPAV